MSFQKTKKALPLVLTALCGSAAAATDSTSSDDAITIYSRLQPGAVSPELYRPSNGRNAYGNVPGYGIVRHDRPYALDKGLQKLRITDVAALIDPTTVTFSSLDQTGTRVLPKRPYLCP